MLWHKSSHGRIHQGVSWHNEHRVSTLRHRHFYHCSHLHGCGAVQWAAPTVQAEQVMCSITWDILRHTGCLELSEQSQFPGFSHSTLHLDEAIIIALVQHFLSPASNHYWHPRTGLSFARVHALIVHSHAGACRSSHDDTNSSLLLTSPALRAVTGTAPLLLVPAARIAQ